VVCENNFGTLVNNFINMNKAINKKLIFNFAVGALLLLPSVILAAPAAPINIVAIINRLLEFFILPILLGGSIIAFIFAGIKFVSAAGDSSKISSAKSIVIWAVVGLSIAFIGFSAPQIVSGILGISYP